LGTGRRRRLSAAGAAVCSCSTRLFQLPQLEHLPKN
jgi:hypothetical protein